jgi:hypothetical protein
MAAMIGEALTERACQNLRETLERLGGDPVVIEKAVAYLRTEREQNYCRMCGTFILHPNPCVRCSQPRRPWPKSRQGYRPR